MSYTTYIWREETIAAYDYDHTAECNIMRPLKEVEVRYYAGMTSQHIEARLVTPKLGWVRDDVEVIWSKTYDNLEDASTVENQCISLLTNKTKSFDAWVPDHARCINHNANNRGHQYQSEWPKYISTDLSKVEKIINKAIAETAVDIPKLHKEKSKKLIVEAQKKTFADIEENAKRLAKDSKVIQDMLAQYIKEHQTPETKRARTKSQWDIVNMKKAIKTLQQTLAAYKTNKLAVTS